MRESVNIISLKEKYKKEVVPLMKEKFGYKNQMAVPKIEKIIINIGFGKMISGKTSQEIEKIQGAILKDISLISGQKPILTKARKSISGFKIRKGMQIGAKVTLRGKRMYDFLERLIFIALPRLRDFKGISEKSFDNKGNLTIGIKEHITFPEVSPEETKFIFGFEIIVATKSKTRKEGIELLKLTGFPIK